MLGAYKLRLSSRDKKSNELMVGNLSEDMWDIFPEINWKNEFIIFYALLSFIVYSGFLTLAMFLWYLACVLFEFRLNTFIIFHTFMRFDLFPWTFSVNEESTKDSCKLHTTLIIYFHICSYRSLTNSNGEVLSEVSKSCAFAIFHKIIV